MKHLWWLYKVSFLYFQWFFLFMAFIYVHFISYRYVHIVQDLFIPNERDYLIKQREERYIKWFVVLIKTSSAHPADSLTLFWKNNTLLWIRKNSLLSCRLSDTEDNCTKKWRIQTDKRLSSVRVIFFTNARVRISVVMD